MTGSAGDEQLKLLMKLSLDEATHERWDDFLSGPIADMNKKNETNLVSGRRRGTWTFSIKNSITVATASY